ncbi:hypothetical protein EDB81DRAFT_813605 [Dactylonectria macrodidyma]|uniref:Uncharacterized protein n=1 Tax=Dactylonectria macrodidyma TaxID=307937 RepID=A0A9P9DQG1_9HYPO|nr:hypothetical protein EDB81DRAFT_813605 [Dactylonectria macrodidyma]
MSRSTCATMSFQLSALFLASPTRLPRKRTRSGVESPVITFPAGKKEHSVSSLLQTEVSCITGLTGECWNIKSHSGRSF